MSSPTIRSICIVSRRLSWLSERSAYSSRFHLGLGGFLAEAVARSGGLSDNLADPASVFLYRGETREIAAQLGIDVSKFVGPIIPVIYNINLRDPAGYFLATTFEMRNKDVIYVSNASAVEATKAMTFFRTVNGTINDPINTAINVYTLRNLIQGGASIITTTTTPTPAPTPIP